MLHCFGEALDIGARSFEGSPAVEIGGPDWRLRKRAGGVFVKSLRHQRYQIAYHPCVIKEGFDDRIGQHRLREIKIASLFFNEVLWVFAAQSFQITVQLHQLPRTKGSSTT